MSYSEILEDPIRAEIFSPERLEQYAYFLASELSIETGKKKGLSLLPKVHENSRSLKISYQKLTKWATEGVDLSPAGEWVIDNFHIIEDQIREIKEDLPEKYYLELPKTNGGNLAGYPRVYALALTLVAHLDSHIEIGTLKRFVHAYQSVTPLLIGEIWAMPIALRIALIENLFRLTNQVVICQEMKIKADKLSGNLLESNHTSSQNIQKLTDELSEMLGKSHTCDCFVISQLSQRLHSRNPEILPACECIDEYLAKKNLNFEEIVRNEHQLQTTAQVSVSNAITSMKLLSNTDWQDFFESLSLVEPILAQDPLHVYKNMEFSTRDQYRNAIERIHKRTGYGEIKIAQEAIRLAQKACCKKEKDKCKHHVGHYLIRKGVRDLEKKTNYHPTIKEKLIRMVLDHPTSFYISFLTTIILVLLIPLMVYVYRSNPHFIWPVLILMIALIPASDSCLNILNLFITYLVGPFILPKINLEEGIPNHAKTFVVIPTIINQKESISQLLEDLEIRFLSNQDKNLYFAILSDFADAESKKMPFDYEIIKTLKMGIKALNDKYHKGHEKFYFFHRKRLWNPSERKWMGWERKRGKIHEFNRFLRGNHNTSFNTHPPYSNFFSEIKYVITLDTDTKLPRNAAKKLVGTILHPLNQPQFDKISRIVTKGYSILQPRISITPESAEKSLFSKIYSGHTGIDPYTTAVSDSYQDLFGEGIYTGKGLYVVDTFESSLKNRVSENTLLSHDLFEGVFARTALVSDIEFLDDYPSSFESFAKRHYRWIRGDWQIVKWIFTHIPNSRNRPVITPLSFISRWKIFDNLRRSLVAPTTFLWFVLGWTILPGHPLLWTFLILTVLALPLYAHTASNIFKYPRSLSLLEHFKGICDNIKLNLNQLTISIVTLPYQTYLHLDAIVRTLYRVYFSKANLLEWTTAAQVESNIKNGSSFILNIFKCSSTFSLGIFFLILFYRPYSLFISGVFLLVWFFSPLILEKVSKTRNREKVEIEPSDIEILRGIACRTWNFFETFVTEKNHWLPPDNFQQEPEDLVAHRTSPTNMGLYLLSACSAYDFGYIGPGELMTRLQQTLDTMLKIPRRFGHFYNWYDTVSLEPLEPEYISTVDSGNLAGHLLAVKQSCLKLKEKTQFHSTTLSGLEDFIKIIKYGIEKLEPALITSRRLNSHSLVSQINNCLQYIKESKFDPINEKCHDLDELQKRVDLINNQIKNLSQEHGEDHFRSINSWIQKLLSKIERTRDEFTSVTGEILPLRFKKQCDEIAQTCHNLVMDMDFSALYDKKRKLFTIGYSIRDGKNDNSYYDLLASEARLTSFLSIAKGDVPENHWFHLGRQMTSLFRHRVLISWSASMFEYLMPLLVMKDYFGTLLNETHIAVIKQQMTYARLRKLPWGISESAFNARDLNKNYQYGPFGVPGLGLKRGLSNDFVVSPYSTALASLVLPKESLDNLKTFIDQNLLTDFGFYEAVDYTEGRIPPKQNFSVIKSFMAHHQGMTLVALNNLLHKNIMTTRFHQDPMVKSSELLLQERIPQRVSILNPRAEEILHKMGENYRSLQTLHHVEQVNTEIPETRVLSNGSYTLMLTAVGSNFSKCGNLSVFRWQEDPTLDRDGQYVFICDDSEESLYSTTFQPLTKSSKDYKTIFSEHKAEFFCNKKNFKTYTEVIVSAEDNVELRRITITNLTNKKRSFSLTSYAEPVLSTSDSDLAHPAFNKLFIQTEYIGEKSALLANRRKRSEHEEDLYGINKIVYDHKKCGTIQFETDREKFLGRKNSLPNALSLQKDANLSNTVGGVLDPIFSFKTRITLAPFKTTQVILVSGLAKSREEALRLIDQYHDTHAFEREDQMSWTQSQITLKHLNLEINEVNTFQKLAGVIIYSCSKLRPKANIIEKNKKSQNALWNYGISGDIPILLVSIKNKHDVSFITDILQFHEYLRMKNIEFDLVVMSDETSSYRMAIYEELLHQVRITGGHSLLNKKGGIFLLRKDITPPEDLICLKSIARIYFDAHQGKLEKQVNHLLKSKGLPKVEVPDEPFPSNWREFSINKPQLEFFNGLGGFKEGGREYQIFLDEKKVTPAPWINVISNSKGFGFLVSESGSCHTWSQNSRENRITPWSNDSILDPSGEIIYLYDQDTKESWSPTPGYARDKSSYLVRHGQGYSIFEHNSFEIAQKLSMYVSLDKEVKFVRLKLKNLSNVKRRISAYYYLEWVLGYHRTQTAHHIITKQGGGKNIFYAQNRIQHDFGNNITFACSSKEVTSFTCHRASFVGRHGDFDKPVALNQKGLDKKIGAGLDPCLAMKIDLELNPQEEDEIIFLLGQTSDDSQIQQLVEKFLKPKMADHALKEVQDFWDNTLGVIKIKTPFPHFDILMNRWMLYQTISSRIWARTAFYQSGGAYGFRDQLQDVSALIHSNPEIARDHILKAAAHQFREGDVLHWWHPPMDRGVRTRFSDDLLWLPYVVDHYVKTTKDEAIFEESIPFIKGLLLSEGQDDLYMQVTKSDKKVTLFEHCILALDRSLKLGQHGLPLMGSGDWNDGMNKVGNKGQGESVWLAWFLGTNLQSFIDICQKRGDQERVNIYKAHLKKLKKSLETTGWDGEWYRRAYFDDGMPLGSHQNDECKIDSIAQSWSILSNLGDKEHRKKALESAKTYLINNEQELVHLFTPPFDKTRLDPGYIKGYLPGIRENGGQYTHAAIWLAMAFAKEGDSDMGLKIMNMINPIKHSLTKSDTQVYKIEPYVIPADIYSTPLFLGKGGWSWYTGSSAWYYRAFIESILGIRREGNTLVFRPSLPKNFREYEVQYHFGSSIYKISVQITKEMSAIYLDQKFLGNDLILPLVDNKCDHLVTIKVCCTKN